jgi:tetratricopeptide (TPR) repeat protein/two-component sensor histidine kinase
MKFKYFQSFISAFFVIVFFNVAYAQKEGLGLIDSLNAVCSKIPDDTNKVKILSSLSLELIDFNLNKGVEVGNQALKLANVLNYNYGIALSNLSLCANYFKKSQWDLAIETGLDAEKIFSKVKDYDRLCAVYCLLSPCYIWFDGEKGHDYFLKATSLLYLNKDQYWKTKNLAWILVFSYIQQNDSSYSYLKQYLDLENKIKGDWSEASSYHALADYYRRNKKTDSAFYYYEKALPIVLRTQRKRMMIGNYLSLGKLYIEKNRSLKLNKNEVLQAEEYFNQAIELAKEYGSQVATYQVYWQLHLFQKDIGKQIQALSSLEQFVETYNQWQFTNDAYKLGAVVYLKDIEFKKKELEFMKIQNARQTNVIIAGAIGLSIVIFLALLLVIVWKRNLHLKRREMDHQIVTLEQKALQSMMNPHFIFNSLGSIQNYLLQKKTSEAGLYLSQFARLIRQNLNSINAGMINLDEETDRLKNYLDLEKMRLSDRFDYTIEIDDAIESDETFVPSMIVQPFIENSIWHGISPLEGKGLVKVLIQKESESALKITVEDNGIGMKKSEVYSLKKKEEHLRLSLEMTRKRLRLLGQKFKIATRIDFSEAFPGNENPGTKVEIVLPFKYSENAD